MTMLRSLLRPLRRSPGFSAVTIATLSLGIAASVAVFSLVNGVLLKQLPYPDADSVVQLDHAAPGLGLTTMGMSEALFHHYASESETLRHIALFASSTFTLASADDSVRVPGARVTPSLFRALGVPPVHGRTFTDQEAARSDAAVVILSHEMWQDRFGGDPSVLGQSLRLDGSAHEVVGVMPPGLAFPEENTALWLVRALDPEQASFGAFDGRAIARLAPGVSIARAQAELERLVGNLPAVFSENNTAEVLLANGFALNLTTRLETIVGSASEILWILLAAVGLILAIASANVANLFLVRVEERSNEIAVRRALGSGRARLLRNLLEESLLLAAIAGVVGIGLAWLVVQVVIDLGPASIPRLDQVSVDGTVLGFAALVSLATGLLFGLLPALRASRIALVPALKEGRSTSAGRDKQSLRGLLVSTQMALGLVLLTICGLVARSTMALYQVEPGFRTERAASFQLALPATDYPDAEARVRFVEQALEQLAAIPGVTQVGAASYLPLSGSARGSSYEIEREQAEEDAAPPVFMETYVSPGHLASLGVPLVEGRMLTPDDHRSRTGNLLVSRSLARRLWPGESAIGKRIRSDTINDDQWQTVVGVVGDVHLTRLEAPVTDLVYLPFLGLDGTGKDLEAAVSFVVRGASPIAALAPAARDAIHGLDRFVPITPLEPLTRSVRNARARLSFTVTVLAMAAVMALLIAAVGLYGMISYLVSCRQRELGIRMALGAARSQIRDLVLRQGMRAAVLGVTFGLAIAFGITRFLGSLLFAVDAQDPMTFLVVPIVLLLVAALATLMPAWRATRIEPIRALRHE